MLIYCYISGWAIILAMLVTVVLEVLALIDLRDSIRVTPKGTLRSRKMTWKEFFRYEIPWYYTVGLTFVAILAIVLWFFMANYWPF